MYICKENICLLMADAFFVIKLITKGQCKVLQAEQ